MLHLYPIIAVTIWRKKNTTPPKTTPPLLLLISPTVPLFQTSRKKPATAVTLWLSKLLGYGGGSSSSSRRSTTTHRGRKQLFGESLWRKVLNPESLNGGAFLGSPPCLGSASEKKGTDVATASRGGKPLLKLTQTSFNIFMSTDAS